VKVELQKKLDSLKGKVEKIVSAHQAAQKEIKTLQAENKKLQTALTKSKADLETAQNKSLTASTMANSKDKAKMIKQINQYIKLIDTSVAQIKGK
jgi:chromosome segregation ATPase